MGDVVGTASFFVALALVTSLLAATVACTGADSSPGTLTTETPERTLSTEQGIPPQASPENVPPGSGESSTTAPAPVRPEPDSALDLTDAQHEDLEAQIAELRKTPRLTFSQSAPRKAGIPSRHPVQPGKSSGTLVRPFSTPLALPARTPA